MSRGAVVVALALIATPALAQSQPDQILEVVVGPSADADADADETIEVIVQGVPAPPGPPSRTVLDRRTAARVPGSEGDAAKVVQSLPGVSRAGLGSGEVVVWGAASEDTRIYLDGVPVPALYHFGGRRGLVPTHTLRAIELVPGAYGLDRGRGLGGLVELSTATSDREGTHGVLTLDTVDAAVVGQVWRPGEVDALAAARYGYHERLVRVVAPEVLEHYPVPRYHDVLVKVTREGAGPQIGALVLVTGDHLERVIRSEDAGVRRSEARSRDTLRCALRIEHAHDDGRRSSGLLYAGHDRNDTESRFGSVPFGQTSRDWLYGLRAEHGIALGGPLTAHLGLDVEGHHVALHRRGSLTLPAREGDRFVFGQPPPSEVTSDRWTVDQVGVAAYLAPQLVLGPLRVVVGGRAELTLLAGDRGQLAPPRVPSIGFTTLEPTFDPRLQVSVAVRDDLELMASAGSYHQPPRPEDLSAVFGNPGLESERAIVASAGGRTRIGETLRIELTGFYRDLDELVARSQLAQPRPSRLLTQNGEGRAFGGQVLVRLSPWHGLSGWVAYTLSRSERKIDTEPGYRLFDRDQPHVLTVVAGYELGGWGVGARFRFASGMPRTPVIGAAYDSLHDRHDPIFGAHNQLRLDDFYQLDLRADRRFDLGDVALAIYLDVQNVTTRQNAEELAYDHDFMVSRSLTGLPTVAAFGVEVSL